MEQLAAFLHQRFSIALIAFAVILGLWGSFQFLTARRVSPGFRSSYLLMVGLTAVQGAAGLATFATGARPHRLLHVVYGIFAIAFLPGVYAYAGRGATAGSRAREAAFLAAACWIVAVAYGRGVTTGR